MRERDYGGYLQMNFDGQLLSRDLRGNVGVRVVETNQFSTGLLIDVAADHGQPQRTTTCCRRSTWSGRCATICWCASRTSRDLSRPNLTDVAASTAVTVSGTQFNVKTGNPNIDPFLANAYDLSFEWYPAAGTLVSVAPFRKDVLRFTSTQITNTVFHGNPFGVPELAGHRGLRLDPGMQPECDLGIFGAGELAGRQSQRSRAQLPAAVALSARDS